MSSSVGTNLLSIYIVHDGMRERIPAGASDESDEIIWNDLICKYICKDNKDNFCKTEFLQAIINGKIQMPGAFELSEIKKALDDDNHHYSVSINRSLDWMITNNLLKKRKNDDLDNSEYDKPWATDELRMLCPEILKYDITVISVLVKGMADAETEIRNSEDVSGIISLLKSLQYGQEVSVDTLHRDSLTKLNQLGVISISLNNHIAISELGKRILSKLLHD